MRLCCCIIALSLLSLLCTSCGENKPANPQQPQQQTLNAAPAAPSNPAVAKSSPAKSDNVVVAPANDAQWTIYCVAIPGPGHVERSKELEDDLKQSSHMPTWYLVHEDQQSTLYYGYYKSNDDPRLKADRQKIMAMADQVGNHPFAEALPVLIASADPTAPPEYNLLNAKGYWSLQIAAYEGPGRKEAAVQSVLEARKEGHEAYYHHGESISEVCIGAWPEEAIEKQDTDSGNAENQDQPILVLGPGGHLPDAMTRGLKDKETHQDVRVLEQNVVPLDDSMKAAMKQFPTHSVNGMEDIIQVTDPKTHQVISQAKPSFIVVIPHADQQTATPGTPDQPLLIDPNASAPSDGLGRLR
jgi:hypothetical protein